MIAQPNKSFLDQVFPIVAQQIRELHSVHQRFIMRDEIANAVKRDRIGKRLLTAQDFATAASAFDRAGNTIDWFSAKFTSRHPMMNEWIHEFDRIRLRGKYAYRPKHAVDTNVVTIPPGVFDEGTAIQVLVNRFERNIEARADCLAHYGTSCCICGFDFEREFGLHGAGYIQVHHLKPLSKIRKGYKVNPISDLRPVCPNCHAMLHRGSNELSIEQLIELRAEVDNQRRNPPVSKR